ncbi:uncharacterized protein ELE39_002696 [Cryptosporidium sp. chipmunk genotype I]|uniref:uncharacterized protein n=1 Tax=Cryptosporidium sp. chipmunk genotype I TaxID=1280935 RepID=UPI003519DDB4|nr:hypothetical protein ELE39_002696 [Cryptosporidium sp. chipmunk genotype I]
MGEIPIVLFTVKDKGNTLFFDAYSQTESVKRNTGITPREYSNYYRFYVSKYKNYNSINTRSTQSKNSNLKQQFDSSNEKNDHYIFDSNKYIEFESNQLNQCIPILPCALCENETNTNPGNYELQNRHLISYVNSQNSKLEFPHTSFDIHNIHINNDPHLYNRKIYTRFPSNQSSMVGGYYSNRELCRHCQYSLKNIDFYIEQSPKYNFVSNTIPEALTMTIMIGVNAIVEVIASIAVKFCAKIPDKDELHPGTGCVLMDYLNDKIDSLLNEKIEIHDSIECEQSGDGTKGPNVNCEVWINNKLDEIMNPTNYENSENRYSSKYSSLYDALVKNCYHKADDSGFDPIKYSNNLPYTLPFVGAKTQALKRGFLDYSEN